MARPKSYFETKEFNKAKSAAKTRGHKLWKFEKTTKSGKDAGFYVGATLPKAMQAKNIATEQRKV